MTVGRDAAGFHWALRWGLWRSVKRIRRPRPRYFLMALIGERRRRSLPFEPHIVHSPTVVHAVDHCREALDPRMPAGRAAQMIEGGTRAVLLQLGIDVPYHL